MLLYHSIWHGLDAFGSNPFSEAFSSSYWLSLADSMLARSVGKSPTETSGLEAELELPCAGRYRLCLGKHPETCSSAAVTASVAASAGSTAWQFLVNWTHECQGSQSESPSSPRMA